MIYEVLDSKENSNPVGPYSPGLKLGDFLYISGQIAIDKEGQLIGDTIQSQTLQVINNLVNVLAEANLEMRHLVKTTVYLSDMKNYDEFNLIYATYFAHPYPARSVVEVSALPKGALVEIEGFAIDTLRYEELNPSSVYGCDGHDEVNCADCETGCFD